MKKGASMIDAPFWDMVAWGRIELPTRGFSIRETVYSSSYAIVDFSIKTMT